MDLFTISAPLLLVSRLPQYAALIWLVTIATMILVGLTNPGHYVNFLKHSNPNPVYLITLDSNGQFKSVRLRFLNFCRSATMLMTCIQVMMVDFPSIFPR